MNARDILLAAKDLCAKHRRPDGCRGLAVTADHDPCRPLDPEAAYWSPTGAVFFVEPWMSRDDPKVWADTTEQGLQALRFLDEAAIARGFANAVRCSLDGGATEEMAMFRFAISLAPDRRSDRRAVR